ACTGAVGEAAVLVSQVRRGEAALGAVAARRASQVSAELRVWHRDGPRRAACSFPAFRRAAALKLQKGDDVPQGGEAVLRDCARELRAHRVGVVERARDRVEDVDGGGVASRGAVERKGRAFERRMEKE